MVSGLLKWRDPLPPSLDHVIPLAREGSHTRDNVKLSHLACNLRKGTKYG
jgi:5-methylcytosine-specific restriction endonuclease McrA